MVEELVIGKDEEEDEDDDEEGEEDEDEAEVVSLRGLRHSQSLPATPRSSETNLLQNLTSTFKVILLICKSIFNVANDDY